MLVVAYDLTLPYTVYEVLAQYYDYEHIAVVHPGTLGEYRLLHTTADGREMVYEQIWPGGRGRSTVRHSYVAPLRMEFHFLAGRHRGVRVASQLAPAGDAATRIVEQYQLPGLPNWQWLAARLRPWIMRPVRRIWQEDLDVDVCIDGWPGVPAVAREDVARGFHPRHLPVWREGAPPPELAEGELQAFRVGAGEVAVCRVGGRLRSFPDRCPHTGGPFSRGRLEGGEDPCVVCPWHGAAFSLATGRRLRGPDCPDLAMAGWPPDGRRATG